jgi:hypothetical protein
MNTLPTRAKKRPATMVRESLSRKIKGEKRATNRGAVCTKTTELATEVYSSEVIHVAKWIERKTPEIMVRDSSRFAIA